MNLLSEEDKQIRFLTNDPRPQRESVAARLREVGIAAEEEDVITSAWATAEFLKESEISTVSVVGSAGLRTELRGAGIVVTNTEPEAVVVGADEQTDYQDIRRAVRHINHGASFIGTNTDGSFPTLEGPAPGAGAIVRAVEAASNSTPTVVGKPEPLMFEMAIERMPDGSKAVMVGDNPDTDILGAHRAGITGVLLSDAEPDITSTVDFRQPDATITTLTDLFSTQVDPWERPPHPWPDKIRPGVGGVLLNESGEVLLMRRADTEQWALPTGSVERCESVEEAVIREIFEETGLEVVISSMTGVYSHPDQQVFSYPRGNSVHYVTICFRCSIEQGEPDADNDEALDVGFFSLGELPSDILTMHPQWMADATEGDDRPVVR